MTPIQKVEMFKYLNYSRGKRPNFANYRKGSYITAKALTPLKGVLKKYF